MKRSLYLPSLLMIATSASFFSQTLPEEMYFDRDKHILYTGGRASAGLYDESTIRTIRLTFTQPNYWQLLQQNYQSKTDLPATLEMDGKTYDSIGVRFKGQTSYSQSGSSQKKSFNITMDYKKNHDLMGYETLNLNNAFQDASFMREVLYLHQIRKHIPAAKANYVKLFINGESWGVYPNVQQLNKDFLKEWFFTNDGTFWRADRPPGSGGGSPGWGDGTAALNFLGLDTNRYKQYYTLKSTSESNPWDDLVKVCSVLVNMPLNSLEAELKKYMDLDRTLWFLASEILFSDDDSYVFKGKMDYYVYQDAETNRITPIEFDGNSVMKSNAANWSPFYNETKVNYPLMNRLFAVPALRQRYLAHFRTLLNDAFDTTTTYRTIDLYRSMIDTLVQADPKKLTTYTDFINEVPRLKSFFMSRRNYLFSNTEVKQSGPVITNVVQSVNGINWKSPAANEQTTVRAAISSASGIDRVTMHYSSGLVGQFTPVQMFDDGQHDDGNAGDGVYAAAITGQPSGSWVRFYIEAVSANSAKSVSFLPEGAEHNVYLYQVGWQKLTNASVVINEFMASNTTTVKDEAGEYDDWIELYNTTQSDISLGGVCLSDNPLNPFKWQFPDSAIIGAGKYLIVWADEDSSQGAYHANFKLSVDGEVLTLRNYDGSLIDSMYFGKQSSDETTGRFPNGTGPFIDMIPTFAAMNRNIKTDVARTQPSTPDFRIYPNPASNFVFVQSDRNIGTIELTDLLGRKVLVADASMLRSSALDLTGVRSGLYLMRIPGAMPRMLRIVK